MVRSDNGLIFQSRRFRAACRDYRLRQEFIKPYTPEQNGIVERFFGVSRRNASGNPTSHPSPRPVLPLLTGSIGTMPSALIKPLAIAARGNSARFNPNSWLDSGGALHLDADSGGRTADGARALRLLTHLHPCFDATDRRSLTRALTACIVGHGSARGS